MNDTNAIDEKIKKFISRHHVITLATTGQKGEPYCSNLFYSYLDEENIFIFTTEEKTRHYGEMADNRFVAASIVLETRTVGKIQGLQLQGNVELVSGGLIKKARKAYVKRFPYAMITDLTLWALRPTFMKFTDNTLGFGKKLIWNESGTEAAESGGNRVDRNDRQPLGGRAD